MKPRYLFPILLGLLSFSNLARAHPGHEQWNSDSLFLALLASSLLLSGALALLGSVKTQPLSVPPSNHTPLTEGSE